MGCCIRPSYCGDITFEEDYSRRFCVVASANRLQSIYVFTKNISQAGSPLLPLEVCTRIAADHLQLADGTVIPANFGLRTCLGGDVLFVDLDLAARTITALPYDLPVGDADQDSSRMDAVSSRTGW